MTISPTVRMLVLMCLMVVVLCPMPAAGTAQAPDKLFIDGEEYALNTNPLERHFARIGGRPAMLRPTTTALWRGYVATWELRSGQLVLRNVHVANYEDSQEVRKKRVDTDVLGVLFPGREEVVADWYTGALIIPQGRLVNYVHMGYASTYERYIVSVIHGGVELRRLHLDEQAFRMYRDARFAAFKSGERYRKLVETAESRQSAHVARMSPEQIDDFIREYAVEEYLSMLDDGTEADVP